MPMGTEPERVGTPIVTTREPQGPVKAGEKGSIGDRALLDGLFIIGACWLLLFLITGTLRGHNI